MKVFTFATVLIFIIIFMIIIKEHKIFEEKIKNKEIKNKIIKKIIEIVLKFSKIFYLIIILIIIVIIINGVKKLFSSYDYFIGSIENNKIFENIDNQIEEENEYYRQIISQDFNEELAMNPYIPNGFKYVEGKWDNGFVIEDENQNQFVWVPTLNKDLELIPKLAKIDVDDSENSISNTYTYDENYKEFFDSVLKHSGFYISRYECGLENDKIVSKYGKSLLEYNTKEELESYISSMYNSNDFKCQLINGYAYDTTISWINKSNEITYEKYEKKENETLLTGRRSYNNVYDLFDNVLEFTDEILYGTYIIRGCLYSSDEYLSRYNTLGEVKLEYYSDFISSRIILFE